MGVLKDLGVDSVALIAQIIIFLIVFIVLNKFAFGPVMNLLLERRRRIEEAEANFVQTKAALANAETEAKSIIEKANQQSARLIKEAQEAASLVAEQKRQEAVAEAAAIIAKGREATKLERNQALSELKRDFGRLVVDATAKITGKNLTSDDQKRLNEEALTQLPS